MGLSFSQGLEKSQVYRDRSIRPIQLDRRLR